MEGKGMLGLLGLGAWMVMGGVLVDGHSAAVSRPPDRPMVLVGPQPVKPATIHQVVRSGDLAAVKARLSADPALINQRDETGDTPLHVAAFAGHGAIVALLLDLGADIHAVESNHRATPLHLAANAGHLAVIDLLLARGADRTRTDKMGNTPAAAATMGGKPDAAARLGGTPAASPLGALFAPARARFDNGRNALNIPFRLIDSHLVLPVRIDGSRELAIILDTGMPVPGLMLNDPAVAAELKLALAPSPIRVSGAGAGPTREAMMSTGHTLSLPGVSFPDQRIDVMKVADPGLAVGRDGVIGHTILETSVVEVDYERSVIHLHDPASFDPRSRGEVLPLTPGARGRGMMLDATVSLDGRQEIPVRLALDIGARGSLFLFPTSKIPFTPPDPNSLVRVGRGVRGESRGYIRPVARLEAGPIDLTQVETRFPSPDGVPFSGDATVDGLLGHDALRRYPIVIFDYSRRCLVIVTRRQQ